VGAGVKIKTSRSRNR